MLLRPTIRAVLPGGNPQRRYLGALLLLSARPTHRNLARVVQPTWAMSADGSDGRDQHGVVTPQPLTPYQSLLCKAVRFHGQGKPNRPNTTAAGHGWLRFHCWYSLFNS